MIRIGHGYDVHRLTEGRRLILGGVEIPFRLGLLGHSDADVLAHAVADAVLGALAAGDIGHLFPDSDPAYEGADSIVLCSHVASLMHERGYEICNIDATLIAQEPKISPYTDAMRSNLARAFGCTQDMVSVKATTEERLGFTGSLEGISAHAVCLLQKAVG